MRTASAVVDRLRQVFGVDSDTDLAKAAGVKKNTISTWRARDSKPFALCERVAHERGVSLDWLLTGEGPMFRGVAEAPGPAWQAALADQRMRVEALLTLLAQLDAASREAVLSDCFARATNAQQLADLRQAVQELEAKARA